MTSPEKLARLRASLATAGVDGFILPVADPHLGEYMPDHDRRLAWLTGFTGSAGIAVVTPDAALVMSDGRYVLQLATETDAAVWQRGHMIETPAADWLATHASDTARIGYDPWLIGTEALRKYTDRGLTMVPLAPNPIDAIWPDQPPPPTAPAQIHSLAQSGAESAAKRDAIAASLRAEKLDAAVITDPASVNWLLNIRGGDIDFTPFAFAFATIDANAAVDLFIEPAKLTPDIRAWLGNAVRPRTQAELPAALAERAGQRVRVDPTGSAAWFGQTLESAGATVIPGPDPCLLPKAIKNQAEQDGARAAHLLDGVALTRFLHAITGRTDLTEVSASQLLNSIRAQNPAYRGESFPAISGAGEDGAIIHYHATDVTDRPIRPNEAYLIDSGGQYPAGTTDVTRTLWTGPAHPPADLRDRYTRVLIGHLDLTSLVFPAGICGAHIDTIARAALWQAGLDYDHGTGHGIGSYLSVHEGPAGIARTARPVPFAPGMILSNEPGFYLPGAYGIRIENLMLVVPAPFAGATKPFLRFETLTLAPYERALIEPALLTPAQIAQVDAYHALVLERIGPHLAEAALNWLHTQCAPLPA